MTARRTWVALLRGIGGATHARMSMADLRHGAMAAGLEDVRTVLATGNLIFSTTLDEADAAGAVAAVVASHGLTNAVILRSPTALADVRAANPFAEAATDHPSHLLVHFLAGLPAAGYADRLAAYDGPEGVVLRGTAVYLDYVGGVGPSKLTGARLERIFGVTGTARNWNTLGKPIDAAKAGEGA